MNKKINWNNIRKDFPVFENKIYLRTMGGGPLSRSYTKNYQAILEEIQTYGRVWERFLPRYEHVRKKVAKLAHSKASEVAFIPSVSFAMNMLALMFDTDDEILSPADEYPSNILPFLHRGFTVNLVPSQKNGRIELADFEKALTKKTKILIISHVEYNTGFKHDLAELSAFCKKHNLIFVVDATQSMGVLNCNFQKHAIDVLVYSTHKWLCAGYSLACMHIRQSIIDTYGLPLIGSNSVSSSNVAEKTYITKNDASAFELGHPDFQSVLSFASSLDMIATYGISQIDARIHELTDYLLKQTQKYSIDVISNYTWKHRSGIMIIATKKSKVAALQKVHIDCKASPNKIKLALSFYNTKEDVDVLVDILRS